MPATLTKPSGVTVGGDFVPFSRGKIYVAGPMRKRPLYNFPAFDQAAKELRAAGWTVFSPAEHDRDLGFDETRPEYAEDGWNDPGILGQFNMRTAFAWDMARIAESDAIYFLEGWETSSGARVERTIGEFLGLDFLYDPAALLPIEHESICQEAHRLVNGPRQGDYGHPAEDFARTGRIWGAILGIPDVEPHVVALCMAGVKISRHVNSPKRDNLTDLAGYAATAELVHQRLDGWPS